MLTHEEEIKLRLFESIASNAEHLSAKERYLDTECVVNHVEFAYNKLFSKLKD